MTEQEKAMAGFLYNPNDDPQLLLARARCKDLCFAFQQVLPSNTEKQAEIIRSLLGKTGTRFCFTAPFWCDYGYNIEIGEDFYANHNCVILDCAKVTFGSHVFIAPNCCFSTAGHPLDVRQRNEGLEFASPILVGNNVWIGANVTVLPGVKIGDNAIIGAGSVVTKNIPPNVVALGNPCRPLRELTKADRQKYQHVKSV